jgi:hypothetical protein
MGNGPEPFYPRCNVPLKEVRASYGVSGACEKSRRSRVWPLLNCCVTLSPQSRSTRSDFMQSAVKEKAGASSPHGENPFEKSHCPETSESMSMFAIIAFRPVRSLRNGHSCSACNATLRAQLICTKCTATFTFGADGAALGTGLSKTSPRGLPRRRDWPRCNRKRSGSTGLLPTYLRR